LPAKVAEQVVIDANAALKAALAADGFGAWAAVRLWAPSLIWSEAASGASQLRWRGEVSHEDAHSALERLLRSPIELVPSSQLVIDALQLARRLGWAKTYDAEYVALAQRLQVPLVTTDGRLAARLRGEIEVLTPTELDAALP
jgi:predicted nucleic acid-binding protein